jgi:O-antigen ligase
MKPSGGRPEANRGFLSPNQERWLLALTLFLIPTNLAYHLKLDQNYVTGYLVDYLIPRLYLSDFPIIILLLHWFLSGQAYRTISKLITSLKPYRFLLGIALIGLIYSAISAPRPLSGFWFIGKWSQLSLFGFYLTSRYTYQKLARLATFPLILAVIFQVLVGLFQYINQSSIFGYLLLGEPDLTTAFNLSRQEIFTSPRVLAYGTTPHPNVLFGFAAVVTLLIIQRHVYNPKSSYLKYLSIISIVISFVALSLTHSLLSFILFSVICLQIYTANLQISRLLRYVLISLVLFITFTTVVPLDYLPQHSSNLLDTPSFDRRYRLNQQAFTFLYEHPLTGTGPNNFISRMVLETSLPTAPFIQPAHNTYLLFLAETGVSGVLLILLILHVLARQTRQKRLAGLRSTPALSFILLISLWDHYPYTLQSGQLLVILTLVLAYLSSASLAPSNK